MTIIFSHAQATSRLSRHLSSLLGENVQVEIEPSAKSKIGQVIADLNKTYPDMLHNKISRIKHLRELLGPDAHGCLIGLGHAKYIIENFDIWTREALNTGAIPIYRDVTWKPLWA